MASSDSPASDTREYVDDRDLARLTPISRAQWQAWRRGAGGPPFSKVGRRCIYRWSDVEVWLAAQPKGGER